ncbi:hypothetical protein A1O1_07044 [Capronia coronata CBS 617.96]|uniref:RRM domain-containing protein n=1 Tax=Capronia coronata CBS 617.96 TaxID=1182541 RepID=W9Y2H5_9EURO|nr:uncharacterized protein A1O1_07044 [Capronia coronata CBS 617.96]EXJ83421.1 hypothetical protein A1O1_07044 [Capronia coronata CBS 617.96]
MASCDRPDNIEAFLRYIRNQNASIAEKTAADKAPAADPRDPASTADAQQKTDVLSPQKAAHAGAETVAPDSPSILNVLAPKSTNVAPSTKPPVPRLTPTQEKLLQKQAQLAGSQHEEEFSMLQLAVGYMDRVVEEHRRSRDAMFALDPAGQAVSVTTSECGSHEESGVGNHPDDYEALSTGSLGQSNFANVAPSVPSVKENSSECEALASPDRVMQTATVEEPIPSVCNSSLKLGSQEAVNRVTESVGSPNEQGAPEKATREDEGDRENLTHFTTWGLPAKRDRPESRVRTVILAGLPGTADYTSVQSLIHGGAIEDMKITPAKVANGKAIAFVTFTAADACDEYCAKYPNGIGVRYKGKRCTVFVAKRRDVDVMSGMMRGYLDCGASRVVKATGADDDWGIIALNKLAQGKNKTRQVEAVTDSLRTGVRTILFRFTNISDAVKFKAELIRDYDWEGCRIDFAEDPCQKATGVRSD